MAYTPHVIVYFYVSLQEIYKKIKLQAALTEIASEVLVLSPKCVIQLKIIVADYKIYFHQCLSDRNEIIFTGSTNAYQVLIRCVLLVKTIKT